MRTCLQINLAGKGLRNQKSNTKALLKLECNTVGNNTVNEPDIVIQTAHGGTKIILIPRTNIPLAVFDLTSVYFF